MAAALWRHMKNLSLKQFNTVAVKEIHLGQRFNFLVGPTMNLNSFYGHNLLLVFYTSLVAFFQRSAQFRDHYRWQSSPAYHGFACHTPGRSQPGRATIIDVDAQGDNGPVAQGRLGMKLGNFFLV